MELRKLHEVLRLALEEAIPETLDEIILKELKEWEDTLLDELSKNDLMDALVPVAEANDYKIYDEALVIDVKNRPRLTIDLEELGVSDFIFQDEIEHIQLFAEDEFDGFVVKGRSGGYWGLDNCGKHVEITEHGLELMKLEVLELLNNPELRFKDDLDGEEDTNAIDGIVYDCIYSNINSIAHVLINNEETLEFKPEFLDEMKRLADYIDEKEKEMNTEKYWADAKGDINGD